MSSAFSLSLMPRFEILKFNRAGESKTVSFILSLSTALAMRSGPSGAPATVLQSAL